MRALAHELSALQLMFEPWKTAPHGPVIWKPEEDDPNFDIKRSAIDQAVGVLDAGERVLAGGTVPLGARAPDPVALGEALESDPEQGVFVELAMSCERVMRAMGPPE